MCPNCLSQIKKKSTIFTKFKAKTIYCRDCGKKIQYKTHKYKNVKYSTFRCKICLDKAICNVNEGDADDEDSKNEGSDSKVMVI